MTLLLGVDPSAKKIAFAAAETLLGVQRAEAYILYKGSQTQSPEAVAKAADATRTFVNSLEGLRGMCPLLAWIEAPLVGRGGIKTTIKQAYVGGVIQACLVEAGFTVYVVHPSTWRAGLHITSRTTDAIKRETERVVQVNNPKLHRLVCHDHDLTDAAALTLYGAEQTRKAGILAGPTGLASSTVQRRRR